jgi:hypothetical protein
MIFEKAIDAATTMFMFDRRSQQQLQAMADEAEPGSKDQFLIKLTHAAFAYYNAAEGQTPAVVRQTMAMLREVRNFREDRVFYTLALKLEVDVLMRAAALQLGDLTQSGRVASFAEEDQRALSICDTLIKNFPPSFDPLPVAWYSSLVPLFPPFRDPTLVFYAARGRDHRSEPLQKILMAVRHELVVASGMLQAKKFLADHHVPLKVRDTVRAYLLSDARTVGAKIAEDLPPALALVSEIAAPRGVGAVAIDSAVETVNGHIEQARAQKDVRGYTTSLLQLGILNFLREDSEETVRALVQTLRATRLINAEDRKFRQYRHDEFPDIPFMIGTAYLRLMLAARPSRERMRPLLDQARGALLRALALQPQYHDAYVNLLLALQVAGEAENEAQLLRLYLGQLGNDIGQLNGTAFRNQALLMHQAAQALVPETVRLLILANFCRGGKLTKAKKMLQELKTLYVLNAHDHIVTFLDAYRNGFRMKDPEFIADMEDDSLHSALLFYLAHAFTSLALVPDRQDGEMGLDHGKLDQGIELNGEALFFNTKNTSAVRLVETQGQIIQYAMQQTEKRWEAINSNLSKRFQYYEDYLRQQRSYSLLRERLTNLKLDSLLPELKIAQGILLKMDSTITSEQRDRLKLRVQAT